MKIASYSILLKKEVIKKGGENRDSPPKKNKQKAL
jgi:hypothetical protein